MLRRVIQNLTIAAMLFVASGCLLTTSNSVGESGVEVKSSTLRQVELGRTNDQWLLATIGEPTAKATVRGPGNVEIWSYEFEREKKSKGTLFLLFAGSSKKVERSKTYFEITDGMVTRYWIEE